MQHSLKPGSPISPLRWMSTYTSSIGQENFCWLIASSEISTLPEDNHYCATRPPNHKNALLLLTEGHIYSLFHHILGQYSSLGSAKESTGWKPRSLAAIPPPIFYMLFPSKHSRIFSPPSPPKSMSALHPCDISIQHIDLQAPSSESPCEQSTWRNGDIQ